MKDSFGWLHAMKGSYNFAYGVKEDEECDKEQELSNKLAAITSQELEGHLIHDQGLS